MHYLFDAAQANLDNWIRHDTPPPHAARIEVDGAGNIAVDQYGNALGGARTPWLDVPTVTYYPSSAPDSCRLQGHRTPFDQAQLATLYPDHGHYVRTFHHRDRCARPPGVVDPC